MATPIRVQKDKGEAQMTSRGPEGARSLTGRRRCWERDLNRFVDSPLPLRLIVRGQPAEKRWENSAGAIVGKGGEAGARARVLHP